MVDLRGEHGDLQIIGVYGHAGDNISRQSLWKTISKATNQRSLTVIAGDMNFAVAHRDRWNPRNRDYTGFGPSQSGGDKKEALQFQRLFVPKGIAELHQP